MARNLKLKQHLVPTTVKTPLALRECLEDAVQLTGRRIGETINDAIQKYLIAHFGPLAARHGLTSTAERG